MQIDLDKYTDFVSAITSEASNDLTTFINSLDRVDGNYDDKQDLHGPDVNVPLLLTGAMGMCGEAGEFSEIVKKVLFHSKPLTEEVHAHLVKELGDVIWYWTNTCRALGVNPNDVIALNVAKLESRYPGGTFSAAASETRKEGDI
ncbi:MAG: nucleoside triphosphate pyrophosphohydrolase family protein [Verrucomicrobiota bacterium]